MSTLDMALLSSLRHLVDGQRPDVLDVARQRLMLGRVVDPGPQNCQGLHRIVKLLDFEGLRSPVKPGILLQCYPYVRRAPSKSTSERAHVDLHEACIPSPCKGGLATRSPCSHDLRVW